MHHVFSSYRSQLALLCSGVIAILSFSAPGHAVKVYRCTQDGAVEFRQTACPTGEQAVTQVIQQSRGMTPATPALRIQKKPARQKSRQSVKVDDKKLKERCWRTEKQLERIEQRLRGGYKASEYQKLHRKQDEYEEYLREFCRFLSNR